MSILAPPFFANGGVVIAELEKMACYGEGAGDFGEITDAGDVGMGCELLGVSCVF